MDGMDGKERGNFSCQIFYEHSRFQVRTKKVKKKKNKLTFLRINNIRKWIKKGQIKRHKIRLKRIIMLRSQEAKN